MENKHGFGWLLFAVLTLGVLTGCNLLQSALPTGTPQPAGVTPPLGSATSVVVASATAPPTLAATAAAPTAAPATLTPSGSSTIWDIGPSLYIDDRSGPDQVLESFYNAINSHQYDRAYSYWRDSSVVGAYNQFKQGYADTASVQLTTGTIQAGAGAGQLYYQVPVTLVSQSTTGSSQTYVGCYTLHLSQPGIQGVPPFSPLGIENASVQSVGAQADLASLLASACPVGAEQPAPPAPGSSTQPASDISSAVYLDNRSGAVQVLQSLFNAINRKEYVRAYSYWESGSQAASFAQFQAGYEHTASVTLQTGTVTSDAGAGQVYYSVPVALTSVSDAGVTQKFVGCYTLHLANPDIQDQPPFQPLAIRSGQLQQAAEGANLTQLLGQACP